MAWATEEIQQVLRELYPDYVKTSNKTQKKKIRDKAVKELNRLQKESQNSDKAFSLPDEDVLDKVSNNIVLVSKIQ
jgi:hypothetical protein